MASVKAIAVAPGDKFFHVTMGENKDCVRRIVLQCVRSVLVPGKDGSPDTIAVFARDTDKKDTIWVCYPANQELLLAPKPGKWKEIWKLWKQ